MVSTSHLYCANCGAANPLHARYCTVCGQLLSVPDRSVSRAVVQANAALQPLAHNHVLKQRYRVLGQIGMGGFGSVYKAADLQFDGRFVAIKEMSQNELTPQEIAEATENFKREAFLLAALTHPNLPSIYDYFNETGRWYLVMSFIEGETLEDYVLSRGGRLSPDKVIHIGIQLCAVLAYLHNRKPPIVFRDLKPTNIMRTPERHLYLIDFGVARHFKPGKSKDTVALGSPGYAAPEQYGKAQTTPRTDIYSLGALLHQLLTGEDPSITPFSFAPLHIPDYPELAPLIMQMLEMDARKRPTNMIEIRETLKRIAINRPPGGGGRPQNGSGGASDQAHGLIERKFKKQAPLPPLSMVEPADFQVFNSPAQGLRFNPPQQPMQMMQHAPPLPSPPPLVLKHRSSRRTMIMGLLGIAAGGTLASWLLATHLTHSVPLALTSAPMQQVTALAHDTAVAATPTPAGYYQHVDGLQSMAGRLNGVQLALGTGGGVVEVIDMGTNSMVFQFTSNVASVVDVAWSPDGTRLASIGSSKTMLVWDTTVGSMEPILRYTCTQSLSAVSWSPDGTTIALGSQDGTVQLRDALSGKFIVSYAAHKSAVRAVQWSPSGEELASASADRTVRVLNIATGKTIFIYSGHSGAVEDVAWSPDGMSIASASADQTVAVWDTRGNIYRSFRGHSATVNTVAWSSNGTRLASGSDDQTLQIWNPTVTDTPTAYRWNDGPVVSIVWTPNGQIASADPHGVYCWMPQ